MITKTAGSRSRAGCLECRRRKRRCDEAKPICMLCSRRGATCVYQNEAQIPAQHVVSIASDHHTLPLTSRISKASFIHLSSQEFGLVCSQYASPPRHPFEADKNAGEQPVAGPLLSNRNLLWSSHPDWQSSLAQDMEHSLVQYYLEVIGTSRVYVPTESNVFLSFVVPVVFHSHGPLLSTVLAMSAGEWGLRAGLHHVNYAYAAARYKSRALQQLQKCLDSPENAEENLLTCVLQASLEISEGSQPTWLRHFRGALAILDVLGRHISPTVASAVLQYFQFRYTLMRTTKSSRASHRPTPAAAEEGPDLSGEPADLEKLAQGPSVILRSSPSLVDARTGCSMELLDLIAAVSSLSGNAASMPSAEIYSKGLALEHRICNLSFQVENDTAHYLHDSAESFRIAAQIYLHTAVHESSVHDKKVVELHCGLLLLLSTIIFEGQPRRSFPMWPLFITACISSNDEHRKTVLELFDILNSNWPVSNINTVLRVIWTIWQSRDFECISGDSHQPDWQTIIDGFGWKLSLS